MSDLHEARFYEPLPDGRVLCTLCPHDCHIHEGGRGACSVRYNHKGKLYTLVYDKLVAREVNPIEKKPLFHFHPGSHAYSISTVGCNLRCTFCQNWQISQWPRIHLPQHLAESGAEAPDPICPQLAAVELRIVGEQVTPETIADAAQAAGCASISYTFTEPTIFYELAFDTAVLARRRGLLNTFVSNGFISEAPLRELATVLDGINVDLKFFSEESYRRISRARLQPILDAIRLYHELGVWVEVTTLVIPGINDSDEELTGIASFIRSVGAEVPWHVTGFYPAYRMLDREPTGGAVLRRARRIGLSEGLRYVYEGNIPGEGGENTWCYQCNALLIERYGFAVTQNRIRKGACPDCGARIDGVGMSGA
jgi:pyruvate formate lyase activating enzyme